MQVKPDRVAEQLGRKGLQRCYLVYGPEPLQAMECADAIRVAARAAGVTERLVFDASTSPDWAAIKGAAANLSLFAEQRLLEIRLGGKKLDKVGGECVQAVVCDPHSADFVLVTADALDRTQQASAWFKAIDKIGVVIACRDLEFGLYKMWLSARATARGLKLSAEAVDYLALRAEGNLLAAAQELDKLTLLAATGELDLAQTRVAVADSARYDVFQCLDTAVAGGAARVVRMVRGLREEGTEPIVLGWSITRELRTLVRLAAAQASGASLETALAEMNVWSSRQPMVRRALQRLSLGRLAALLDASIRLDHLIKGYGIGNVWDEIESLYLALAGGPWLGHESGPGMARP